MKVAFFICVLFASVNYCYSFSSSTNEISQVTTKGISVEIPRSATHLTSFATLGTLYPFRRRSCEIVEEEKQFPDGFIWGAASSSYQIEGAWNIDGKGENIWDNMTHAYPDRILDRSNGDVAANSYEFYKEDIRALKQVGLKFYRFSISWSRVLPNGDITKINRLGLLYYSKLIDELLGNGIRPIVTIYHWEMPQKLQDLGGMTNPIIIDYFLQYAKLLFEHFGDRVKMWATFNEPMIMCNFGYNMLHAPFIDSPGVGNYLCGYHSLLAHAKIYRLYHQHYNVDESGKIGIVFQSHHFWPKNPKNPEDIEATNRRFQFWLGWFAHPIFSKSGGYPKIMEDTIRINSHKEKLKVSRLPVIDENQKLLIRGTADFFFLNYYTSEFVAQANQSESLKWPTPSFSRDQNLTVSQDPNWPVSATSWLRSIPGGLRGLLNWIKTEYNNPPVIITENGWSDHGELEDIGREQYLRGHLQAVLDALIEDGCDIRGHITWSIIDNFEWTSGYLERFGLFHIDFASPNKTRIAKESVQFLRKVIETGKIV